MPGGGDLNSRLALAARILNHPDDYEVGRQDPAGHKPISIRLLVALLGDSEKDPAMKSLQN
ncbi:hypothetical protein [Streptantibioticus cattleyicolor]|uniref:Uncharacterized protein n=1 Tax=Streptantibioticus cattleyicolor (strain ATCC 35852 / DSM 46488 / JCM 4925 / NBRC 14057 / NRRL 8057) TaxID=1003195 RepID=F8JMD7_STREN|nr:hypothetical protein [Streptantibioticus cattleyicolor]AEW99385.1 hypothetical protein SCATT_p11920 [Streptantibioticus cattleyicolor NRRL 8057 = DSM 46488]CCB71575.1 protein of unknown function [Streptantibioticus cattleyicolor NRRL 8057 = DSM 46488]